jgi:hypothetical protein
LLDQSSKLDSILESRELRPGSLATFPFCLASFVVQMDGGWTWKEENRGESGGVDQDIVGYSNHNQGGGIEKIGRWGKDGEKMGKE